MLTCLQKGSGFSEGSEGFALLGCPERPLMGSLGLGFLQAPDLEQNCDKIDNNIDKNMLPGQHVANFYMQNESRQHPQHGETAFEISCIGKCLHTLTNIYTRSFGTTFT